MLSSIPSLAIVPRPGSFSDRWIDHCAKEGIACLQVDPFDPDVFDKINGVKALAWHWSHADPVTAAMARQMTAALEAANVEVFPNTATAWHFDDKIGQAYLLKSVGAPTPKNWILFERDAAIDWVSKASFPIVHKLRGGAGASNVRLVRDVRTARKICYRAFGRGFISAPSYFADTKSKVGRLGSLQQAMNKVKRAPAMIRTAARTRWATPRDRGYVLFQEFMPGNAYDTRVTVIGNRAFAFVRANRPGDFRASGSGRIDHAPERIDQRCVEVAFAVAQRIRSQSMAFDFVFDHRGEPTILEISYAYQAEAVHGCPGHWDAKLRWHEGSLWPQDAILADLLQSAGLRNGEREG